MSYLRRGESREAASLFGGRYRRIRVEACDTCQFYLKSVDLTVDGLAVPLVDEVATVTLDLWATEHGYKKVAPNLMGF